MALRVEEAHELTDFLLLCIFCSVICSCNDQVESVKKVSGEQKRALFTRLTIRQQSPYYGYQPASVAFQGQISYSLSYSIIDFPYEQVDIAVTLTVMASSENEKHCHIDSHGKTH